MRCEEAREQLIAARYGAPLPLPEAKAVEAHVASCQACRSAQAAEGALDAWLGSDEPAVPRPGFDTRFFARLEQERARGRRRRWTRLTFALVPVAAAVAVVVLRRPEPSVPDVPSVPSPASMTSVAQDPSRVPDLAQEDLELVLDLELIEELEVVQRIDELEAFDTLADVDDGELEALLEEAP